MCSIECNPCYSVESILAWSLHESSPCERHRQAICGLANDRLRPRMRSYAFLWRIARSTESDLHLPLPLRRPREESRLSAEGVSRRPICALPGKRRAGTIHSMSAKPKRPRANIVPRASRQHPLPGSLEPLGVRKAEQRPRGWVSDPSRARVDHGDDEIEVSAVTFDVEVAPEAEVDAPPEEADESPSEPTMPER